MHLRSDDNVPTAPGSNRNDPTLGIAIGVLLSIVCIVVCLAIIVSHRRQIKRNQSNAMASPNVTSSSVAKIGVSFDQHEMETLITKPISYAPSNHVIDRAAAVSIGAGCQSNRLQIGVHLKGESSAQEATSDVAESSDPGEGSSDGKYGFILSSTPKREDSDHGPVTEEEASLITNRPPSLEDCCHSNHEKSHNIEVNSNNNITTSTPKKPPRKIDVIIFVY